MKSPLILTALAAALILATGCRKEEKEVERVASLNEIVYNGEVKNVNYSYYSVVSAQGIDFYNLRLSDTEEPERDDSDPTSVTDVELQPSTVDIFISSNLLDKQINLMQDIEEGQYPYWDYDAKLTWNNSKVMRAACSHRPETVDIIDYEWDLDYKEWHNIASGTMKVTKNGDSFSAEITAETEKGRKFTFRYSGTPVLKNDKR